jgi:hypothetical protein
MNEVFLLDYNGSVKGVYSSIVEVIASVTSFIEGRNIQYENEYKRELQEKLRAKISTDEMITKICNGDPTIFQEYQFDRNKFLQKCGDKIIDTSKIKMIEEDNLIKFKYNNQTVFTVGKMVLNTELKIDLENNNLFKNNSDCICGGSGEIQKRRKIGSEKSTIIFERCERCNNSSQDNPSPVPSLKEDEYLSKTLKGTVNKRKLPWWTNIKTGEFVKSITSPGIDYIRGMKKIAVKGSESEDQISEEFSEDVIPILKPIPLRLSNADSQLQKVSGIILPPSMLNGSELADLTLLAELATKTS